MALYALDSEGLISASDAPGRGNYRCLECNGPLQHRQGRRRPHFYHVKATPSCRLYSKSEDHLLLQLQIQNLFPTGTVTLEKPFLWIGRIADVCCDQYKLIFEIQCSLISETEVKSRIDDYGNVGYQIVWLLDDRLYNRKILRPAELLARSSPCYFFRYQRISFSPIYDQLEIIVDNRRPKKSAPFSVHLQAPKQMPPSLSTENWPKQIVDRSTLWPLYFQGDLLHKALQSAHSRPLTITLQNWCFLEKVFPSQKKVPLWKSWLRNFFIYWGSRIVERLIQLMDGD